MSAKKKNPCPYKALVVIINEGRNIEDKVLYVFKNYDITRSMISFAKGTAPSNFSDFFGFGIDNKIVVSTFVDTDLVEQITDDLKEILELDKKNRGMIFTLPITALSSNILGLWRETNESKIKEQK